jgi:hypothetical protein
MESNMADMNGMKWIFRQIIACCSLLFVLSAEARQETNAGAASAGTAKADSAVSVSSLVASVGDKERELILLREQNKLFKDFQSLQQTTVYWSLTGVFGLVMILVGASFYTNFRFYERDKESLKVELDTKLENFGSIINSQMLDQRREADQSVERNSQRIQDIMLAQLSEVRASLDAVRLEISNDIKSVSEKQTNFEVELRSVRKSLSDAEVELRKVELEFWDAQDIPDNMIITLCQALKAASGAGDKRAVSDIYEKMAIVLKEKYEGGFGMDLDVSIYTKKMLDLCAQYDPKGVAEVKKHLSKVKVNAEPETETETENS